MASKVTDVRIAKGERIRLETPGGGGHGDPRQREPARVARDVRLGYVSLASAGADYGVALSAGGDVDAQATKTLRTRSVRA